MTIRTLDAGGDKPIAGVTMATKAIRSSAFAACACRCVIPICSASSYAHYLARRGMARCASCCRWSPCRRNWKPRVTLLDAEMRASRAQHSAVRPKFGIMIEVPAAAIAVDRFDSDFFSIGSNDLTQYVTAAGRDIAAVADLADPLNPAVLRLIESVARHGRRIGRDVSLCGDAGGEPG